MRESSSPCHSVHPHTNLPPTPAPKPHFHKAPPDADVPEITILPFRERNPRIRLGLIYLIMAIGLGAVLASSLPVIRGAEKGSISSDGFSGDELPQLQNPGGCEQTTEAERESDWLFGGDITVTDGYEDTAYEPAVSDAFSPDAPEPGGDRSEMTAETSENGTPETDPLLPQGCYPFVSVDMSERDRGAGYIVGNAADMPGRLPDGDLWGTNLQPAVLIVHTLPFVGYSSGESWYDTAAGALSVTDTPGALDGTVALGAFLTRTLRNHGVTVIHLRIAVSAGDTAADVYARTENGIRYYCKLYPDIAMVLNLRRSAELTSEGGVLRTEGSWEGESCAQLRVSVNGGRSPAAVGRDLAVALTLRRELWNLEPSLSRPVWVKSGNGLICDLSDVCVLTLDIGSAGNTYDESERVIAPLATALERILSING